ncbi:polysaccharide biosynthesis C-terminal domain-containing protein [Imperialibacter roseus]|uniref:Polysaccharide biosynthesis C-terminal domain-containing protein n=1 Tax=Imperialibacter roseus TaxID=1324217 RepID=A0ABZ0IXH4_9BACT|nr:polysaccharide biosynthesis C-terminal domain-containing protein [Imperialibacter roseus]WOK09765.1 polysaccharide biosynthesis C-terminal domain-containing protein [Imperialibacter roseus]
MPLASVVKDLASVASSKGAMIVFGLGKAMIIARYLGPELNGVITALLVYPTLFMTFGALGVRKSSAFLIGSGQFGEEDVKAGVLQAWLVSTLFSVVSIFILIYYLSNGSHQPLIIFLAIAPVPFSLLNTYLSGIYLGNNQIAEYNKVEWVPTFILFLATVVLVVFAGLSLKGALIAELLAPFLMSVLLISRMRVQKYLSLRINRQLLGSLFSLGMAFAVSLLVINLNYRVDVIIMDWLSNKFEIGIYSKGSVLSQYLWQIPMLLGTIVFARGARATDRRVFSLKVTQLLRISLLIIGSGCVVLALGARLIIMILFGSEFLPSAEVMLWLMPGVLLLTIFKVLNMDMGGQGKPWFALKSMVPALGLNIVLNILLIPRYGAVGAAFTSTLSYSLGGILFLYQYSSATGISIREIFAYSREDFAFLDPYIKKIKNRLG